MRWTAAETDRAWAMRQAGMSDESIGAALGRTRSAVTSRLRIAGRRAEGRAFVRWLLDQADREDNVGQLAAEVLAGHIVAPKATQLRAWHLAVYASESPPRVLRGVAEALSEWRGRHNITQEESPC